jgi:hypothetical protein
MPANSVIWNDERKDWYAIMDEKIKKDASCVAVVLVKNGVMNNGNGYSTLKTKNYGKLINLCECERFRDQPVSRVPFFTSFLVKEDIIATAGHCVGEWNVADLRIVFGYKMLGPFTPVTEVPNENIYKGLKTIRKTCKRKGNGSDWALVQLDRKVKDQELATLSRHEISVNQAVHVIGHPMGLPLKYAARAKVCNNNSKTYFTANLNIYNGNSGSPVFNSDTHEVIGIVVRGYNQYFRLKRNCWVSIDRTSIYCQEGAQCTRISEFIDIVDKL